MRIMTTTGVWVTMAWIREITMLMMMTLMNTTSITIATFGEEQATEVHCKDMVANQSYEIITLLKICSFYAS